MARPAAALHASLNTREAEEVRRWFGFTEDLGQHFSCKKWLNPSSTEILYLPNHATISAASFIQSLEYLNRTGDEYYEAVRAVRGIAAPKPVPPY